MSAFHRAAASVPAYRQILSEAGVHPCDIHSDDDFPRLPILDKQNTFHRFPLEQLCAHGRTGNLSAVLTSSGHSGIFAFGLYDREEEIITADAIDAMLDSLLQVRSRPTLVINCLPMGVKVFTRACVLAEVSVRADMATALIKAFSGRFEQFVLVGDPAFIKHLLEFGAGHGVEWRNLSIHIFVGEEVLAENARRYFEGLIGASGKMPPPLIASSMGIGEIGLNLFYEAPPGHALIALRRFLHEDPQLRRKVLSCETATVPSLFTYDRRRIHVEFTEEGRLLITTLGEKQLPLIRYAPGDCGSSVQFDTRAQMLLAGRGIAIELLAGLPLVAIGGRGAFVRAGDGLVTPEQVKEGLYLEPDLACRTTANFRLTGGPVATVRLQLKLRQEANHELEAFYAEAIGRYAGGPVRVRCERYEAFGSGMTLDYERKFDYLGP